MRRDAARVARDPPSRVDERSVVRIDCDRIHALKDEHRTDRQAPPRIPPVGALVDPVRRPGVRDRWRAGAEADRVDRHTRGSDEEPGRASVGSAEDARARRGEEEARRRGGRSEVLHAQAGEAHQAEPGAPAIRGLVNVPGSRVFGNSVEGCAGIHRRPVERIDRKRGDGGWAFESEVDLAPGPASVGGLPTALPVTRKRGPGMTGERSLRGPLRLREDRSLPSAAPSQEPRPRRGIRSPRSTASRLVRS